MLKPPEGHHCSIRDRNGVEVGTNTLGPLWLTNPVSKQTPSLGSSK